MRRLGASLIVVLVGAAAYLPGAGAQTCSQYAVSGTWQTHQGNNYDPAFSFSQSGTAVSGTATLPGSQAANAGFSSSTGRISQGSLTGDRLDVTVSWSKADGSTVQGRYTATLVPAASGQGSLSDGSAGGTSWTGSGPLTCTSTSGPPTDAEALELLQDEKATDRRIVESIADQIREDARKAEAERWKVVKETQTKVHEIEQEVVVTKARSQDKAFKKWEEFLRDGRQFRARVSATRTIGKGSAVCADGRCRIVIRPTAYGRRLIEGDERFGALITVRSTVAGADPTLTVRRAYRITPRGA